MSRFVVCLFFVLVCTVSRIDGQPPRPSGGPSERSSSRSVERWVRQLANDLDHLQEDLYYERGQYPGDLRDQVDRVARSVAHFEHTLSSSDDERHLRQDFQDMDRLVHDLVHRLNQTRDTWLQRQASRITYSDEQIHYVLQRRWDMPGSNRQELLARQTHLLELGARDLQALDSRLNHRDQQLRAAIRDFVDLVDHFHDTVEEGADRRHLREDFRRVDDAWHEVVEKVNRSSYIFYLRMAAQNVNRIHDQIDELINDERDRHGDHDDGHRERDRDRGDRDRLKKEAPPPPPPAPPAPRRRPAIEFEIPGIGRFQIPR